MEPEVAKLTAGQGVVEQVEMRVPAGGRPISMGGFGQAVMNKVKPDPAVDAFQGDGHDRAGAVLFRPLKGEQMRRAMAQNLALKPDDRLVSVMIGRRRVRQAAMVEIEDDLAAGLRFNLAGAEPLGA